MIDALQKSLTTNQIEIVKTVLYFDLFKYPLTEEEVFENSAISIPKDKFLMELSTLVDNKFFLRQGEFILCAERTNDDIVARLKGNTEAEKIMPLAHFYSKKIASFPFVEAVCLSGGLSKKYYDEKGDIDFFIITKPNRLWLCRTLLILRYKLLPAHKRKYWCTNYFISSDNLEVHDINPFTATELAFLIPTVQYGLYSTLLERNNWYKAKFPNKPKALPEDCADPQNSFFKGLFEGLFSGKFGTLIDAWLLNITLRHWQKKYPELNERDFELQFRSQKNVCKRHTKGFQNKILNNWQEKQKQFESSFNVSLQ